MSGQAYQYRYWGKARPESADGPRWHPLARHSLDVAAVADQLLQQDPWLRQALARTSGLDEDVVSRTVPFFVALHDLGKFSESFQGLVCDLAKELQGLTNAPPYNHHHDTTGYLFWLKKVLPTFAQKGWLAVERGGQALEDPEILEWVLQPWIRAVTGHHGSPPQPLDEPLRCYFRPPASADTLAFVEDLYALFDPPTLSLPGEGLAEELLSTSAWLIAGLTVLSDWLGSNQGYFAYNTGEMPLAAYWEHACNQAKRALAENGLLPVPLAELSPLQALFPDLNSPTPLQQLTGTDDLGDGPQLFLIEEVTGGGKTESAIHLSHRLMTAGRADGIFFALPTMATANAMRQRLEQVYPRLYAPGTNPSFILAHSASDIERAQRRFEEPGKDLAYGEQHTAGQQCAAWLQDNRKKALLAQVGVGTLDQALLGILPSRHSPLRLVGLARKVLLVDEVHAYDPYMHALLQGLLRFHASFGGSAILLSATLPRQMRRELIAAFRSGLGVKAPVETLEESYPLLTRADASAIVERPLACRVGAERQVPVRFYSSSDEVLVALLAVVEAGGCAVWIRNTVRDALEGLEMAERAGLSSDQVTLFHARFMLGDRLRIEDEVLERFGKTSTPAERAGRLVIATQVVEQSLDIDFDFMVSDSAPVELLIQRAGRLHRHKREGRPGVAATPLLGILAPTWSDEPDAGWLQRALPGSSAVYRHHGQMWLTMRVLQQRGCIDTPKDSRHLVESVYGEAEIPEGLMRRTWEAEGEELAHRETARINAVALGEGYAHKSAWLPDTRTPTRIGEQQSTWELAQLAGNAVAPLCIEAGKPDWLRWRLSQVQVRHPLLAERAGPLAEIAASSEPEKQPKWIRRLALTPDGEGWVGKGLNGSGKPVVVRYDSRKGLHVQKGG